MSNADWREKLAARMARKVTAELTVDDWSWIRSALQWYCEGGDDPPINDYTEEEEEAVRLLIDKISELVKES